MHLVACAVDLGEREPSAVQCEAFPFLFIFFFALMTSEHYVCIVLNFYNYHSVKTLNKFVSLEHLPSCSSIFTISYLFLLVFYMQKQPSEF